MACEDSGGMANVVIVVVVNDTEKHYGVFHLHFDHFGNVILNPSSFLDKQTWVTFTEDIEWHAIWCDIIRTVYPEDYSLHAETCRGIK